MRRATRPCSPSCAPTPRRRSEFAISGGAACWGRRRSKFGIFTVSWDKLETTLGVVPRPGTHAKETTILGGNFPIRIQLLRAFRPTVSTSWEDSAFRGRTQHFGGGPETRRQQQFRRMEDNSNSADFLESEVFTLYWTVLVGLTVPWTFIVLNGSLTFGV